MTIIKINAITVPAERGDLLAQRFAPRAHAMDSVPGSLGFELLRPEDGRDQWLVVTRWDSEDSYQAWVSSEEFAQSHRRSSSSAESSEGEASPKPAGTASEMWSYSVAVTSEDN